MNNNLERVKIVVVGDSGVGKTSLVHLITRQAILKKSNCTIGCSVDVKLHEYRDGTIQHKTVFIEFYDIGGNSNHRKSAKMFFSGADGIILVHDLTNRKSQDNLAMWLTDVHEENESISVHAFSDLNDYRKCEAQKQFAPLLVVGTKLDEAQIVRNSSSLRSSSPIAVQFRSDEINLDCMQTKYLAPASTNSIKLAKFFDKAIEYKMQNSTRRDLGGVNEKAYFGSSQSGGERMRERNNFTNYSQFKR